MRGVETAGRFTVVRFEAGAVLLDPRRRSIIELTREGAHAFDLLVDRVARLPSTEEGAVRGRRALRALRRELFGEPSLGPDPDEMPDHPAVVEGFVRRHAEPTVWRRASASASSESPLLSGRLVRAGGGALLVQGNGPAIVRVAAAFASIGIEAIGGDGILVVPGPPTSFRATAQGEMLRATEIWTVASGERDGLTIARLPPERAFVELLRSTRARLSDGDLAALAACAEDVRHFSVIVPRDTAALCRVVADYWGLAFR